MANPSFITELRRRHIFRVAIAYAVTAWLLLQLGAIVFPALHAPGWCEAVLLAFLVLGLPVALLLAWAFEMTPEGVRRTVAGEAEEARPAASGRRLGRRIDFVIIVVLAAAVGVLAWRQFGMNQAPPIGARAVSSSQAAQSRAEATALPAKSIAVLPFANLSGDPKQRYFSDGLSEDLILALNQYPQLTVIGRESSFRLRNTKLDSKQIGERLGVANLLEGSVSRESDRVRVRAELVDARTGHLLWSNHYDRAYQDLFALQDDITQAVTAELKAKLLGSNNTGAVVQSDRPPSGSLSAYNAYLEGNFYLHQNSEESFREAIAAYERAIAADPKYAAALAKLSRAWTILGWNFLGGSASRQAFSKAGAAADEAIRLDPNSAVAYEARGFLLDATGDWHGAETASRRALTLAPSSPDAKKQLALSLWILGRFDESMRLLQAAIASNPLDVGYYLQISTSLAALGRLDEAQEAIERAISLEPAAAEFHAVLAAFNVLNGMPQAALRAAHSEPSPFWQTWALAIAYHAAGDETRADQLLQRFVHAYGQLRPYFVADLYAARSQPDEAFAWLDRAWRQRDSDINLLSSDPFMLRYKDDPRFAAFCRKVGLPVPGATSAAAAATAP